VAVVDGLSVWVCHYVSKKENEKVPQRPIHVICVLFVQKEKYFLKGEIGTMP
jgi:hypothetical protein